MSTEWNKQTALACYKITTDLSEFDFAAIHEFIANSYWAKNMPFELLKKAVENSFSFALLTEQGEQVGFARLITDKATFAYLADVYIVEAHRGQGLSKWLMQVIIEHPELQNLRRISLVTKDAQGLYQQFGFQQADENSGYMHRHNANIYLNELS